MNSLEELEFSLRESLDRDQWDWLVDSLIVIEKNPKAIARAFSSARRKVGSAEIETNDTCRMPADIAARIVLLGRLYASHAVVADEEVRDLYRFGDVSERLAIMQAFPFVNIAAPTLKYLVEDALRSNDARLVANSLTRHALSVLSDDDVAHAVMKCIFMELPIDIVQGLEKRVTPNMSRMVAGYMVERVTAGREVDADLWRIVDRFPPEAELQALKQLLESSIPEQKNIAELTFSSR